MYRLFENTRMGVRHVKIWRSREDSVETIYLKCARTWNCGAFGFCKERLPSFDVVHIYGPYDLLGPAVARACRRGELPYVVEP